MESSNKTELAVESLKDFVAKHGFTQVVPTIRFNVNEYPFLTFINKENEAENVYFSKSEAEVVSEPDFELSKEYFGKLKVAYAENANGDVLPKLTTREGGNRLDLSDLF